MTADPAVLRPELLDDFYTECDELLSHARTSLATLRGAPATDLAILEGVFRSVHTLKGNSAIVGLRQAEELAHRAEGQLRRIQRSQAVLDSAQLDLLETVLQRVEQIITAHRLQQPIPTIEDLLGQLREPGGAREAALTPEAPAEPAEAPGQAQFWRCSFTPSPALEARGINLNQVRARLSALGKIVRAAPVIRPDRGITFEFELSLQAPPADLAGWEAEGMKLQPLEFAAAPAPAASAPDPAANLSIAPSHIVRVDLGRLDDLMRITGEMVIHRSRLEGRIARLNGDRTALQEVNLALGRSLRELREAITRVRLVPVAEIFARMPFVVRDLARESGKRVQLALEGQQTEIDKYLVERLKEPFLHLVRNAISHGIEDPDERIAKAKPAEATITLRASTTGQSVVIQISDDGRGIDVARVSARARAAGIPLSDTPTDNELLNVICRPGFSTRDEADRTSGRGVGMDVVHNTLRELGGTLGLENRPGLGARFSLRLPLTLSIAETFLVSAADQTCAVPQGFVEEIIQIAEAQIRTIQQVEVISYRDGVLPLVRLRAMFGAARSTAAQLPVVVLSSERGLAGLVVDRVIGQREVVVRAMQDPLIRVPGVSGATELGDGKPVLILDAAAMTSGAVRPRAEKSVAAPLPLQRQIL